MYTWPKKNFKSQLACSKTVCGCFYHGKGEFRITGTILDAHENKSAVSDKERGRGGGERKKKRLPEKPVSSLNSAFPGVFP